MDDGEAPEQETGEGGDGGLAREEFVRSYGRDSTDYADAILSGRGDDYVPSVGFHVTKDSNADSILESGLDPAYGGRGGASEAAGVDQFVQNSQGQVHYSTDLETSQFYSEYLEGKTGEDTTLLGVVADADASERDPDDPRQAFRTTEAIGPDSMVDLSDVRNSPYYGMHIPTYEELHPEEGAGDGEQEQEQEEASGDEWQST